MDRTAAVDSLSPRQRQCLLRVGQGKTSAEIAFELGIADATVDTHIANGMARLGTNWRREAGYFVLSSELKAPVPGITEKLPVASHSDLNAPEAVDRPDAQAERPSMTGADQGDVPTRPLTTIVLIAALVASILIALVALKPIVGNVRDIANILQPDRPH